MANGGGPSHFKEIPLEQAHKMRRDEYINELEAPVRKITRKLGK